MAECKNYKSQAPNIKTCPLFFGGKIPISNDQNPRRKNCPAWNLKFVTSCGGPPSVVSGRFLPYS
jgi:hypothetical protein